MRPAESRLADRERLAELGVPRQPGGEDGRGHATAAYVVEQIAFLAGALPLVVVGVVSLWRQPALRALSLLAPLVSLLYLVEQGRSYYALPAAALPLAAGVVVGGALVARFAPAGRRRRRGRRAARSGARPRRTAGLARAARADDGRPRHLGRQVLQGRARLAGARTPDRARVERDPAAQRRDTALLAQNYGEAGALARFGPRLGLPAPLSGHLSFQYWRPAELLPQRHILAVGIDGDS